MPKKESFPRKDITALHTWVKHPQSPPVIRNPFLKSIHCWTIPKPPPFPVGTGELLLVDGDISSAIVVITLRVQLGCYWIYPNEVG